MRRTGGTIVAAFASAWACFAEADATSASLPFCPPSLSKPVRQCRENDTNEKNPNGLKAA